MFSKRSRRAMRQRQAAVNVREFAVPAALETLRARGDAYALLNTALDHLERSPDDPAVTLLASQTYVMLGLIGPARDLLRNLPSEAQSLPDANSLAERIARAPSGRVAWGSLQGRFESNFATLAEKYPVLKEWEEQFRRIPRNYELYRTRDGNYQVGTRPKNGKRRWLPDLCDVRGTVTNAELPHDPKAQFCGPYLITGDRFAALFNRVYEATARMFLTFSPRIYLIETDVTWFGITLYVCESVDRLCDERTLLFIGVDAVDRLVDYLNGRPMLSAPEFAVRLTATGEAMGPQVFEALQPRAVQLAERADKTRESVHRYYESLPADHWKKRFGQHPAKPLCVLGLTSRFTTYLQYSMRDWAAAFEQRGHEFRVLTEANDHDLLPAFHTAEAIEKSEPDLIVCIDHFRHEYRENIPGNVPFVGWIQDALPHLYRRECGQALGRLDYYIARDVRSLVKTFRYPASRGIAWPMVTNDRQFSSARMSDEELAPYRCDFSFVSSHSKLPADYHEERRGEFQNDSNLLRLIDCLFKLLEQAHHDHPVQAASLLGQLLDRAQAMTGVTLASADSASVLKTSYLYPVSELIFRQYTLAWVADYCDQTGRTLHLYGNGWEKHPRFAKYARGFADNGQELRAIYQASKINLQITTFGAVHQRMLDGLAAGGFFLIRRTLGDTIHDLGRRLLAAIRQYNVQPDTPCAFGVMPELDEAMREFWQEYMLPVPRGNYSVPRDLIDRFEELAAADFNQIAGAVFDQYEDLAFASSSDFGRLAGRYLDNEGERAAVASAMRKVVVRKFTYGGLVDRMLSFIAEDVSCPVSPEGGPSQALEASRRLMPATCPIGPRHKNAPGPATAGCFDE
ncbi:MAG: hypothetical protein KJ749_04765, partial [Planctomycetes bacterium]|nr:hypothetical protein [Planctomycetota bacterium]